MYRVLLGLLISAGPLAAEDALPSTFADLQILATVQALEETQGHNAAFGMSSARYELQQTPDGLSLKWTSSSGRVATAPAEILASYQPSTAAFLWAWGNDTVPDAVRPTALALRDFAVENDVAELRNAAQGVDPINAERLAAIGTLFPGVEGIFGAAWGDDQVIFFGFGEVTLQ